MDAANARRRRRLRLVGLVFTALNVVAIAALLLFNSNAKPVSGPTTADEDNPGLISIAAARALDSHPLGLLLVPYEHSAMQRFVDRAAIGTLDERDAHYAASSVRVFYIVLDEVTWLLVGLFVVGLIGSLFAFFGMGITGGVLMLLPVPVPIISVGPGAVLLTSYLLVGGVLALVVRPRRPAPDLSQVQISPPESSARSMIIAGALLLVVGIASSALAVGLGSDNVKLWVSAVGCTVGGLVSLVWGLVEAGRHRNAG